MDDRGRLDDPSLVDQEEVLPDGLFRAFYSTLPGVSWTLPLGQEGSNLFLQERTLDFGDTALDNLLGVPQQLDCLLRWFTRIPGGRLHPDTSRKLTLYWAAKSAGHT